MLLHVFPVVVFVLRWFRLRSLVSPRPVRARSYRILAVLLAACVPGFASLAADRVRTESVWLEPVVPRDAVPYRVRAVLLLPSDWVDGDGAVILLGDPQEPIPGRLRQALLAEGAAVLDVDQGDAAEGSRPLATPDRLQLELDAAFGRLRFETGVRHVAIIGTGTGAATALGAPSFGARYALAVALTEAGAVVRAQGGTQVLASFAGVCQALAVQGGEALAACREALAGGAARAAR